MTISTQDCHNYLIGSSLPYSLATIMSKYQYEDAVKQLQETGVITLNDFKKLPYEDLVELLEEIKIWCLYASGKADKLNKESKKKKKKKKE